MREKVKRLLDLVRAGKLTLEDAAPLLAALNPRLTLTESDRELIASLLAREDLGSAQVAEHLLLLRGVREVPQPPFAPRAPRPQWTGPGPFDVEGIMAGVDSALGRVHDVVEAVHGAPRAHPRREWHFGETAAPARILRVQVESSSGDEYTAHLPVSLAPHLDKLIPPHGREALERAGLSVEALQLLVEAGPPPGDLIEAEDSEGNSVRISLK
ncbi:hypothetical protein [Deinococcus sp. YIM 77859]|uniref:SHOCT-like domain-containing protein n=1 Tax=Deinococcus sp. YIM 77859 TaxID=1540221 RepID=UPI000550ECB2|nr:hypothetical protein [Deinococcus sp. YIM 77859]